VFAVGRREFAGCVRGWIGGVRIVMQEETLGTWVERGETVLLRGRHFRSIFTSMDGEV